MKNSRSKGSTGWSVDLRIDWLPKINTSATRRHWSYHHRENQKWNTLLKAELERAGLPDNAPLEKAKIVCYRCSSREPDFENLVMGFKGAIDQLVHLGVLVDDNPRVLEREYRWEKSQKGHVRFTISEG